MSPLPEAWFLAGPTASGKTDLAHELALQRGAWVLCADSMTVYRGMEVGTAKPSAMQRAQTRYFGLDLVDPATAFSVASFLAAAREAFAAAQAAARPLLVVGGSGLYLRCLLEGLREGGAPQPATRAEAEALLAQGGVAALRERVRAEAPRHFALLADPSNPRRLVRAWENARAGLAPEATWTQPRPRLPGLRWSAAALAARIEARVNAMFASGLLEEVAQLRRDYPRWSDTAAQAIGYAEALTHLRGGCTLHDAMERTRQRTRQLARRQMTWFRRQADMDWIDLPTPADAPPPAAAVQASWQRNGPLHARI